MVCGHIHRSERTMIDGIEYVNCGDWVESCTALVEHDDGRLEILDGLAFNERVRASEAAEHGPEAWPEPSLALRSTEVARKWNRIFAA